MSLRERIGALLLGGALLLTLPLAAHADGPTPSDNEGLDHWLTAIEGGLDEAVRAAEAGRGGEARQIALRLYLDYYERIEGFYGPGGPYAPPELAEAVAAAEQRFHVLMTSTEDPTRTQEVAAALGQDMQRIREVAQTADVPLVPELPALTDGVAPVVQGQAEVAEIAAVMEELDAARTAYLSGDADAALAGVEHAYLEGLEPLEPRLPSERVKRLEQLIHLGLRPQIAQGAATAEVERTFDALAAELLKADAAMADRSPFWFGAINAFIIILREGMEAVLLVAALLAYLGAVGASSRYRKQIYAGVGLGVVASFATWFVARTLIPISGGSRELLEGVTALVAVAVLLYVSHWLFHKSYVHDWKNYLQENLDRAVSGGSALAMAGLAFAAIYREGFETVLFYQALLFDSGSTAVLAGFVPGMVLILVLGVAIIRLGLRLPLKKVFGITNTLLLYLAFVFLGKGIYNLQEGGVFAPHPLPWMPDHEALRQLFGLYPLAETLAAQLLFLVALGATYLFYRRRVVRRREKRAPQAATA